MNLGELAYKASLDSKGFTAPLQGCQQAVAQSVKGMQSAFSGLAKTLGALGISFAAFKSVEGIMDGLRGVYDAGKELKTTSEITGQTIRDLVVLKKAFKEVGIEDSLETNMIRLQKSLGGVNEEGVPTVFMFQKLGLNIDSLKKMAAPEQFEKIGKAINKLPNQADKAAAAMAIFGRQGASMLALFANPSAIEESRKSMGTYAAIMQRNAVLFAQLSNVMESLSGSMRKVFVGVADQISADLLPVLKTVQSFNFTRLGQQIGAAIHILVLAFKDNKIADMLGGALEAGAIMGLNKLVHVVQATTAMLGECFSQAMTALNQPETWDAMGHGIRSAVFLGMSAFDEAFRSPLRAIQNGMIYVFEHVAEFFSSTMGKKMIAIIDALNPVLGPLGIGPQVLAATGKLSNMMMGNDFKARDMKTIERDEDQSPVGIGNIYGKSTEFADKSSNEAKMALNAAEQLKNKGFSPDLKKILDAGKSAFKGPDMMKVPDNWKAQYDQFVKMMESLIKGIVPVNPVVKGSVSGGMNYLQGSFSGSKADMEGDKLSKIGLFVGGNARTMDYLRAMAENTAKLVSLMTPRGNGHLRDGGQVLTWS